MADTVFNVRCATAQDSVPDNARDISISQLSVSISGKQLFIDTDVRISAGHRYGLMGPNGRGKTTLLKLIAERHIPVPKNLHIHLVAQEQEVEAMDTPAVQVVIQSDKKRLDLLEEFEQLSKGEDDEADPFRLQQIEDELQAIGAYTADSRARKILFGLGFPPEWQDRPTKSFSGGWRKRISLASAIFMEPDLLLLDEPTNHLDLNAVIWLENYLPKIFSENAAKQKSLVVVSHDVSFLDNICSDMLHIDKSKLNQYTGNYHQFVKALVAKKADYDRQFEKQKNQIKEMKRKGNSTKQVEEHFKKLAERDGKDRANTAEVFLEKRRDYVVTFPFQDPPALRESFITQLKGVEFHYPEGPTLFEDVTCALWTNSRVALVGPNGIGKTTLLNLMCGILKPTEGTVEVNRQLRVGRYSQHFVDQLPTDCTPIEYLLRVGISTETDARRLLGSFGLDGTAHHTQITDISGGQKARVAFAGISVSKPHVLLFDEPTNHLDLESIEALATALNKFQGAVLIISHDAKLLTKVVQEIWVVEDKTVTKFDGDFDDYREEVLKTTLAMEEKLAAEEEEKNKERETARLAAQAARQAARNAKGGKKGAESEVQAAESGEAPTADAPKTEVEKPAKPAAKQAKEEKAEAKTEEAKEAPKPAAKNKLNALFAKKDIAKKK